MHWRADMKRNASAAWSGGLKEGSGSISTASGVLHEARYGFQTRFAEGVGTNPEELLGAAHAGCFTMALSATLEQAGFIAGDLDTKATVELNPATLTITNITLDLTASQIQGLSAEQFNGYAKAAKENC